MGFTKPIEQYLFGNLLTKIHGFMYLKDIIRDIIRGYLKMNGLGILDICSKADKEGILKVLETNKE